MVGVSLVEDAVFDARDIDFVHLHRTDWTDFCLVTGFVLGLAWLLKFFVVFKEEFMVSSNVLIEEESDFFEDVGEFIGCDIDDIFAVRGDE